MYINHPAGTIAMASVRKRVRVRVGREPLITWVADYKGGAGRRHMKTLPSKGVQKEGHALGAWAYVVARD